ncbi:MAG: DUF1016 N-terminal domain-containing protein [Planctomycetota bacterium]|nr:DUF1016 N-terminal domain-containing protein [Planctomycetota bacterium]
MRQSLTGELSWMHYVVLLKVEDEKARLFYMTEAAKFPWSVRQLEQQINTLFTNDFLLSKTRKVLPPKYKQPRPRQPGPGLNRACVE